jgi:hypothetical protein
VRALRSCHWSQSIFTTQTVGRGDHVLTIENFQKLSERLFGVGGSSLDVLIEQRLRVAHGVDDEFLIGHADESGDVHSGCLRAGRLAPRSYRASIAAGWIGSGVCGEEKKIVLATRRRYWHKAAEVGRKWLMGLFRS